MLRPIKASPEFIRDNQYNNKYKVVDESWDAEQFNTMLEYYGECRVMVFPSGKRCFFCINLDV